MAENSMAESSMAENSMAEKSSMVGADGTVEESSESGDSVASLDDVELSLLGITLLMNDQWAQAEELFNKYKDYSPTMSFGASFVMVMQGIMSFEDEKLHAAVTSLKETEKKCEVATGFLKGLKKKKKKKESSLEDRLTRQIVVGDCLLYQSILTFINQDLASYVKGGWTLRKAWKLYEKTYKEINKIHDRAKAREESHSVPSTPVSDGKTPGQIPLGFSNIGDSPSSSQPSLKNSRNSLSSQSSTGSRDSQEGTELPLSVAQRLLGSVSFGYGTLQLVISLVPPKILKLIEFLGFDGDRPEGIKNLELASKAKDMKAPLAMFALVWYHTVIRPFFALDGTNVNAGIADAEVVIERCRQEYPESALYLFFKARVLRLKAEVDESFATYNLALERCTNQREIQLISIYEIGWLHMMKLEYLNAYKCFMRLKEDSKWSKCYYAYLTAICQGAFGDVKGAHLMMKDVPGLQKRKNNQLETFVSKRASKFKKVVPTQEHLILLILEVLFLWNAIPNCKPADLERHLEECNTQTDKGLFHVRSMIEGAIYRALDSEDLATQCFEEAIVRQNGAKEDKHVAAFSCYELGTIHVQKPEGFQKAKKYFLQAKDHYKDYDFDNRLHVRVTAALKRMKTDGTPV